tara:strand:- start:125 stop:496 length:372 start_codon:yes stop_codon:yes gene_type:complete
MTLSTSLERTIQTEGGAISQGELNLLLQKSALSLWVNSKMKLTARAPAPVKTAKQFLIDFFEDNNIPPIKDENGKVVNLKKVNKHVLLEIYEQLDRQFKRQKALMVLNLINSLGNLSGEINEL